MKFSRLNMILVILLVSLNFSSNFLASETESEDVNKFVPEQTLSASIDKATANTNFNGTVVISQNTGNSYNVLYEDAAGTKGGYDADTLYDIGSVSKLYTTTAIMLLEEDGLLNYDDSITKYLDNVPSDKQDVTIKMLLTHTSGIYVDENEDHQVTKDQEVNRILSSELNFEPGSNYVYSNAGFTLLAAIIESASGVEFEQYLTDKIFEPLNLEKTGFPNSDYLHDIPAVNGTLDGINYGPVNNLDFGWYSKGYTDIISTPREITYFFQALISGNVVSYDNLDLMNSNQMDLGNGRYRGYGAEVKGLDSLSQTVGHAGVWYGGNTAVYYRPADEVLFVLTCDELVVGVDLPAIEVYNTLSTMYPVASLDEEPIISREEINVSDTSYKGQTNSRNDIEVDPLSKESTLSAMFDQLINLITLSFSDPTMAMLIICIIAIIIIISILVIRRKRWYYLNKAKK